MFVKKLVDDLNYDNEVLYDNNSDLKTAFMFLFQEHKKLKFELEREKRNALIIEGYRKHFEELRAERDKALETGMQLKKKIEMMNDIMKIAVQEEQ